MNYDRIKNIFIDLYEELCDTFDDFESDFAEAINKPVLQKPNIVISHDTSDKIIEYFEKITGSKDTAEKFIKEVLAPVANSRSRFDVSNSYHQAIARETATSVIKVSRNPEVNYTAFKRKLAMNFQIYKKDILDLVKDLANRE